MYMIFRVLFEKLAELKIIMLSSRNYKKLQTNAPKREDAGFIVSRFTVLDLTHVFGSSSRNVVVASTYFHRHTIFFLKSRFRSIP